MRRDFSDLSVTDPLSGVFFEDGVRVVDPHPGIFLDHGDGSGHGLPLGDGHGEPAPGVLEGVDEIARAKRALLTLPWVMVGRGGWGGVRRG